MKTIQRDHPPHHRNGFVATCRLWTASGGVHALDCSQFSIMPCSRFTKGQKF